VTTTILKPDHRSKKVSPLHSELDLYRVFANAFRHPSAERFAWLFGKEVRALLKELGRRQDVIPSAAAFGRFPDYASYEAAYIALFEVGAPQAPVPLQESAHSHRQVPQEIVLECVNFYDVLGLRPSGSVFPSDHLVTQLEFLAAARYLRRQANDSNKAASLRCLEHDFMARHLLNWLPVAQEKLDKANPPLFPQVLRSLTAYLKQESVLMGTSDP
jgi:DMSO reductase family type II enzyme chaperone